jgi:hypothetical protein
LIGPYYFVRFVIASIRQRSLWFYRYPPGHYGSTIPSQREITSQESTLFDLTAQSVPGIALNTNGQLTLLRNFLGSTKLIASTGYRQTARDITLKTQHSGSVTPWCCIAS